MNLAMQKPLTKPTTAPAAKTASRTFEYNDPTANTVAELGTALEKITIHVEGEEVEILQPERWIKTINLTIKRFKERYGSEAGSTIVGRYVKGWEPIKVYVEQGISRRSFCDRREKFLKMLLLYAVQNNLLDVS